MTQDFDVLSLLATRRPNHSLPRPFYTDPQIFRLDLEQIWYRSWLFAVPTCELPKPIAVPGRYSAGPRKDMTSKICER